MSGNRIEKWFKLCLRLTEAHAHAIDVMNHSKCWTQCVTNVLQSKKTCSHDKSASQVSDASFAAAKVDSLIYFDEKNVIRASFWYKDA